MTREEFLQRRRYGIGGSDVAAIMGLSPWRTPLDVFYDKTGSIEPEPEPGPQGEGTALYWGTVMEPLIAKAYEIATGRKVCRYSRLILHPEYPFFIGDVDRLVYEGSKRPFNFRTGEVFTGTGLEIKTCRFRSEEWGDAGSDVIPVPYYLQVQWYMMLLPPVKAFDVAVLFAGSELVIYHVERDPLVIDKAAEVCRSFWIDNVTANVPPPPMSMEDLKRLRPWANVPRMTASAELEAQCRELAALQNERKKIEAKEEALKFTICDAIGDAEQCETPAGEVLATYKNNKRGGRVLLIKKQKGEK